MATTRITTAALAERLRVAENNLRVLQRQHRGTTSAHARVARLEGELVQLRQQLGEQGANPVLAGQITSFESAVAELNLRVGMLEEGQTVLSERVDTGLRAVNDVLDGHGQRIAVAETAIAANDKAANERMDRISGSAASAHARIDAMVYGLPVWGWLVAGFLGALAGIAWWSIDFPPNAPANYWWVPSLAGLAGFAFVAWLISMFYHPTNPQVTASASAASAAQARPVVATPNTPPAVQPAPAAVAAASAHATNA